ncbi:CitMHS family citrate-Mg2+:H+ or citrate-Ca2+:H+ symporter [Chryseobacterium bernardetii]|uniref:CitMHS family citrate-Mg2+:H+ or citrate-Ca2+:H+ symporter n=3 Tax=Chryseobacterium TaxID=59732 RepID=A0A543ENM3_9FLAO|nr:MULTISPECIES: citrate:proton symporter [Chryseobacterium]MDR6369588.1 CitMHS family citrate-Mg2+:H+ or citrate-Ca2+:H+ symporter [Chryseobacterium vietnamense]MDR6439490.1 CitMHS family citrate-Mg2+:H+ or citrate-Ca2+:H+ symporter [Chryseobacterium bernardetii]MDR6459074.1 CitMHS family citrate-Mg2+:H+ or citrate-Ca2+:H+ symporter [Chryseobacterium vietnamense]TQM23195.1 CitMHS family citrate-Mg2+:H+ or citrate-Ca2+:H+ symporter [Chryseobacterium aquifrigidense]
MLTFLGFLMIFIFMILIMNKKMTPLTALVIVPVTIALFAGFGPQLGDMMKNGVKEIALTGVMLIFAILYFSLMIDTGLFEPLVNIILKAVGDNPIKTTIGTAVLTALVSLDGDGSSTYLIVVAAMLPLYKRQGMNPLILTCIIMLAGQIMNILPWGGPTARVMSSLKLGHTEIFVPMIPIMAIGILWVIFVAYILGRREKNRIARHGKFTGYNNNDIIGEADPALRRPKLILINLALTITLLVVMILDIVPLGIAFMIAFCIASIINYPKLKDQQKIISKHAGNALSVAGMIFGAGIFTGILNGSGIMQAMGNSMIEIVPKSWGGYMNIVTALFSIPFTFFLSNDAYYFGILPIIVATGHQLGISPEILGRASLIGQGSHLLSPLVPSTYLLVSLAGVEFSDHLKYTLKWALGSSVIMLLSALILGII